MHPLDYVVACIHRVGIGRQQIHQEGAFCPTCCLERLVPPAAAFQQCGAEWLGSTPVYIVMNGVNGFAVVAAGWIFFLQTMTGDKLLIDLSAKRSVHVPVA